jgi:hypothetical protein
VPDVHIFLPAKISKLRKVAERMHSLTADHILLSASRSGELKLAIEKDDCRVETTWKDCARPKGDDSESSRTARREKMADEGKQSHKATTTILQAITSRCVPLLALLAFALLNARAHAQVKLDMKSFMRLLSSNIVDASSIIACICEAHCAIFYVRAPAPSSPPPPLWGSTS